MLATALVEHGDAGDCKGQHMMLRTFSGRQPHPAAGPEESQEAHEAEPPEPSTSPGASAPPVVPETCTAPPQDAAASQGVAQFVDPPDVAAAAMDGGSRLDDSSDDSDADDELTAAIAEARLAARRLSLSVDGECTAARSVAAAAVDGDPGPPPPPPPNSRRGSSAASDAPRPSPAPHRRRLSHEERATPLSHLRHLLMPARDRSSSLPRTPSPQTVPLPPRASMAAAAKGFARRGEKIEGVKRLRRASPKPRGSIARTPASERMMPRRAGRGGFSARATRFFSVLRKFLCLRKLPLVVKPTEESPDVCVRVS